MNVKPFLVQAYAGCSKPADVNDYLKEFSQELNILSDNGVLCGKNKTLKTFNLRCFICDAPAASFVTGRKSHSSENGCPKCIQICSRDGNRLLYQNRSSALRTDESFLYRLDPNHHRPVFLEDHSVLEKVGVGMVSQFVIDPMHLIDLGNTYKILYAIINNHTISRLSKYAFDQMDARFLSFRSYVPTEFERKPRTLKELHYFKANELRQLLSYTLPVLLKGFVSEELHRQVLLLHVAVRLLQDPNHFRENSEAARYLLDLFVSQYSATFGIKMFTYNTHCILHIPDYVEKFGALYSISAYKPENHMRLLRKLLRKNNLHLQQFFNRFAEISFADDLRDGLQSNNHFHYNNFILKPNCLRDGCCMVQPGIPLVITELKEVNGTQIIRGKRFLRSENFFEYPVASMENLGVILASDLSVLEEEFPIDSIVHKYYRLPIGGKYVLTPLIHSSYL